MPGVDPLSRVVVFLQENKTPDFYFRSLAAFGAEIEVYPTVLPAAPDHDQPHDRSSWVHFRMGDYPGERTQLDTDAVIPLYAWLAKSFVFCDHHFGIGSNSTSGHLMAVGGQTPTLKNPPFGPGGPVWDMPSIFAHAERGGVSWAAFPDQDHYPIKFYQELNTPQRAAKIHPVRAGAPDPFVAMAKAGTLPRLVYAWGPGGADEHPPYMKSDPAYLARGHDLIWQRIDAVVKAGDWANTTFILTWDDWGGYADHVVTPSVETVVDVLHPGGFPVIGGSRLPLVMFGGKVGRRIDSSWHSHASIPKTIIDLFGLPNFGVRRVDTAPSLAGFVNLVKPQSLPPALGSTVVQPVPPVKRPKPVPPPAWIGPLNQPLAPVVLNGGITMPAPSDAIVRPKPPPTPKSLTATFSGIRQ